MPNELREQQQHTKSTQNEGGRSFAEETGYNVSQEPLGVGIRQILTRFWPKQFYYKIFY